MKQPPVLINNGLTCSGEKIKDKCDVKDLNETPNGVLWSV